MKIAITGGTGFIGKHLALALAQGGDQVVSISRGVYTRSSGKSFPQNVTSVEADITDLQKLVKAFEGCQAVVHCAGTSQEDRFQTFQRVHVDGARCAVEAARQAGIRKFVLVSYLHVRPNINSAYHTTKWEGEQIVRQSGLDYTILKVGLVYGPGDHLLNNLGNLLRKLPVFATVGLRTRTVRLVAVEDVVAVIRAALTDPRLSQKILAVVGPEEIPFGSAVRRIAKTMGKPFLLVLPLPVFLHRLLAGVSSKMPRPMIAASQVQMLADGISTPLSDSEPLPADLAPKIVFDEEHIRQGLPG